MRNEDGDWEYTCRKLAPLMLLLFPVFFIIGLFTKDKE